MNKSCSQIITKVKKETRARAKLNEKSITYGHIHNQQGSRDVAISHTQRESGKMRKKGNMFQAKNQNKTSEKDINGMEISNLQDKVVLIKTLHKLGKRMDEHSTKNQQRDRKYKQV